MESLHVAPLARHARDLLPPEPDSSAVPHVWRWADLRRALLTEMPPEAGDAERRVLLLLNPGSPGRPGPLDPGEAISTSATLLGGVQMLLPGERAPAHRHTPAAVRFVIEGQGAITVTDGEALALEPGDMVVTPSWTWHDHESQAEEPVVWLDVLDIPMVRSFGAGFFELYPRSRQPVDSPVGRSVFPWATVRSQLMALTAGEEGTAGMVSLEYLHPGGLSVTPTLGCSAHMVAPGATSSKRKETASSVFHVVSGRGRSLVGEATIDWSQGDVFVVPGWRETLHSNLDGQEPAFLFSVDDSPALRSLGLYRSS